MEDCRPATSLSKCCCTTLPHVVTLSTNRTRCTSASMDFLFQGLSAQDRERGASQPYMRGLNAYVAVTSCQPCVRVTVAVISTGTGSVTFWLASQAAVS